MEWVRVGEELRRIRVYVHRGCTRSFLHFFLLPPLILEAVIASKATHELLVNDVAHHVRNAVEQKRACAYPLSRGCPVVSIHGLPLRGLLENSAHAGGLPAPDWPLLGKSGEARASAGPRGGA